LAQTARLAMRLPPRKSTGGFARDGWPWDSRFGHRMLDVLSKTLDFEFNFLNRSI
jgi:hypothetical protein